MSDVTQILARIDSGDPSASNQLLPLVYDELKKLAAARLKDERPGQTLSRTALVHEAYIRLVDQKQAQEWNSRGHFFAAAASRISGSQSAATSFPLAAGNTNPQGIADPPTGASASSFAVPTPTKLGIRAAAALARSVAAPIAAPPSIEVSGAGEESAVDNAAGDAVVFSGFAAVPPLAVLLAPSPVWSPTNASFPAVDHLMAEFGNSAVTKNLKGLTLALDTVLDGLFAAI